MNKQRGFTLIELMVVLVILGIIMGLVVPNVVGRGDEARVTAAQTDIQTIGQALEMYRLHNSHYPSTDQGLEALVSKPSGSPEPKNWRGPYLQKMPKDPWENPYGYINDGGQPEVISYGADGREGGEDLNQDITSSDTD
ncbi:type II secretion system major pseudopilin GspG [Reinekea blandensis]|uniref:Type II secretion system core protein G n=1 Tax=Reinekea blandensis MED297 TaxID=314283 RepID=A4BDX3_9GAMM|nr:type II secretion system major pseudopilin GspG [Reinekea blandensis]EAR09732.1 general secretion pathway protein G [Reinekea blandensis MED297]